jgi:hypothetical protein
VCVCGGGGGGRERLTMPLSDNQDVLCRPLISSEAQLSHLAFTGSSSLC